MGKGREFVDKNDAQIQKYLDKSVGKIHFYRDIQNTNGKAAFLAKFRQLSRFAAIFIEKSIIFNRFYVEISIIFPNILISTLIST